MALLFLYQAGHILKNLRQALLAKRSSVRMHVEIPHSKAIGQRTLTLQVQVLFEAGVLCLGLYLTDRTANCKSGTCPWLWQHSL